MGDPDDIASLCSFVASDMGDADQEALIDTYKDQEGAAYQARLGGS